MWAPAAAAQIRGHADATERAAPGWHAARPLRAAALGDYTRLALAAAEAALTSAGRDPRATDWNDARVGLALGTALGAYAANERHRAQIAAAEPSPRTFVETLPSAPVGALSIALGARGPQLTLAMGRGAELAALAEARRWIASGRVDRALAGRCDLIPPSVRSQYENAPPDGACFFVLEAADAGARGVCGGGAAYGVGARDRAIAAACREAGVDRSTCAEVATLHEALHADPWCFVAEEDLLGGAVALVFGHCRTPGTP
jgi:hypothetical protein